MRHNSHKIALFSPRNLACGREILRGLEATGFEVVAGGPPTRLLTVATDPNDQCRVAVLVAGRNHARALGLAEQLGERTPPPNVVLVIDDLSAAEYEAVVNRGPVRYIFRPSDSMERILGGVLLAGGG